ncbi:PAS domain S-box protein [Cohnella endophytica]|uniref:histidine kinase n=1 Tax=Cohnella endophytica TaxID=2419778 RepID=A0A494XH51_9BACL|nr:PAS domain S-box protein [Cohnella endophytica]RKP49858.1 PAS domain S-box protein [Cohnella endophytica]
MIENRTDIRAYDREEMYRIVAENTMDTIVLVDSEAIVRYVSPSIHALTGYSVEEYEGMDAFGLIVPEDRGRIREWLMKAIETKTPVDVDYRILHTDGGLVYVETRVKPVLDADNLVKYVVAVVRDVTRRKQTEQLLENILENVNALVWSTDKDFSRHHYFAGNTEKICSIPKEEIVERPIRIHDSIHPEDNDSLMGEVKQMLDKGVPVRKEFRWVHIPEEIKWGQLIVHPHQDGLGNVERLDGIILDINEKKRAELALEESEQRYKSLFEHNLDGVFSIELKNLHFVNANEAFERTTGIEMSKLTDRCFIGLIHDEDHPSVFRTLLEVMQQGEPRDIECRLARMDRGERIVSITFVPIFLSDKLNGVHGILKDITKRKQEERDLVRSEERSKFLQMSLNRLSSDLGNVMKVAELEKRLSDEVRSVLPMAIVRIEEGLDAQTLGDRHVADRIRIRIGEKPQPVYLCIEISEPLAKIEAEWLDTAVHYVKILYDNLHRTEDLMKRLEYLVGTNETPKWMLRLLFRLSEKERAALSSDLHDSVLQDLIIWYRKLESLRSANKFGNNAQAELVQIENGLLDAIHQIRITCNELRPPFLLKMGLVESLKSLFEYARMFSNYEIEFVAGELDAPLHEDQILGVYRIVQELLNNASKHSRANRVAMSLEDGGDHIRFRYADDGVGIDLAGLESSYQHMGIAGIEKRVLSLEGEVDVQSAPGQGFHVTVTFPKQTSER